MVIPHFRQVNLGVAGALLAMSAAPANARRPVCVAVAPELPAILSHPGTAGPALALRARAAPPSESVLRMYRESGAKNVVPHRMTEAEWKAIEEAVGRLPPLYRQVLQNHLRHLSFVDTPPGAGNALTSRLLCDGRPMFDLTLRSGLFNETLTEFLNGKEGSLFVADASGYQVRLEAGSSPALAFILLHELTHAVDMALGVLDEDQGTLGAGVWTDKNRGLAGPYAGSLVTRTIWRGGSKIPIGQAPALYGALSNTPFPTVYATAYGSEDLAETVAWEQLSERFGVTLRIEVRDHQGATVFAYEPLKSPLVRARFPAVERLLLRREAQNE